LKLILSNVVLSHEINILKPMVMIGKYI